MLLRYGKFIEFLSLQLVSETRFNSASAFFLSLRQGHDTSFLIFSLKLFKFHVGLSFCSSLRKKCPYSELFWSVFFRKYLSVFSPNAGKYGSEQLRVLTLFTQCLSYEKVLTLFFTFYFHANPKVDYNFAQKLRQNLNATFIVFF